MLRAQTVPRGKGAALRLIQRLPVASIVLPVQALGELFMLVLKAKRPATNARAAILGWRDAYAAIDTSGRSPAIARQIAANWLEELKRRGPTR
jgi:predicted nucleic acid-binding protein